MLSAFSLVEGVESSPIFLDWRKSNSSAFLSSIFVMAGDIENGEWVVSYYDRKNDAFTSFTREGIQAPQPAFAGALELKLSLVKLDLHDALASAEKILQSRKLSAGKRIVILQPLSGVSHGDEIIWNITFITLSYSVLNVKISAETGKILGENVSGIMDFMQKDKA